MDVQKGQIVRIDVELKVSGGDVIESSQKSGPVEYKHGSGQLLDALEKQLEGMKVGDEKKGTIKAADAFGAPSAQVTKTIPRASFPKETKLDVGQRFEAKITAGQPVFLEVTDVSEETIVAKVIHPLADKDIDFQVKVLAIRPPPPPVPPPPESIKGDDLLEDDA
ncbi:MAG: FKBP-type peptidyl-prolyl cis-trans isomerase [Labilithrix sp.]|nr:FKBP-type peptidyl-prolyl cis-trans isomerase [Labilithrix sp.]MCW5812765.1 FKBP-type peptidyl-prolyl cis-trans isomerase [Labilithrix sp.]